MKISNNTTSDAPKIYEFNAEIKKVPNINGAYVEIPLDVKKEFGKGRVLVYATFDGVPYEGQMVKMGTPCHIIGITKAIREELGKQPGETVFVTIMERDAKPPAFRTIEEYISQYDKDIRERMEKLRAIILSCSPHITEKISWQMPTFVLNGNLVHFAAAKRHLGFFPTPSGVEAFAERLKGYKCSKGAIRFPYNEEMPFELIRDIVLFRVQENTKSK